MHLKSFCLRRRQWTEEVVMCALPAKEIGYLKDHFIESVTENWRYFRFSRNLDRLTPPPAPLRSAEFCQVS